MSAYTRQKAKTKYRDRIRLKRAFREKSNGNNKTPYDRVKQCRERKRMNTAERINDGASSSAAGAVENMQVDDKIASTSIIYKDILNELNKKNFMTMLNKIKNLEINTQSQLEELVHIVFERAIISPESAYICAKLSQQLSMVSVQKDSTTKVCFLTLIISKCQNEFVSCDNDGDNIQLSFEMELTRCVDPVRKKELESLLEKHQNRKYGNIRFIGELYKMSLLTWRVMIFCMNSLIGKVKEDNLEILCVLITSIGKNLEDEGVTQLNKIFETIRLIAYNESNKIGARVRGLLKEVIILREQKWIE